MIIVKVLTGSEYKAMGHRRDVDQCWLEMGVIMCLSQ